MSHPPVSVSEVSLRQAEAGAAAQQTAAATGGDPATLADVVRSAQAPAEPLMIQGEPLHGYTLQVILCMQLSVTALGAEPLAALGAYITRAAGDANAVPAAEELLALGRAGYIFTRPAEAYELLADAAECADAAVKARRVRDFDAAALEVTGSWTPSDIGTLVRHVVTVGKPAARDAAPAS
jgi:hypothetical protein